MTISCEIVFERNSAKEFYSGQYLRGFIHLALKTQQNIHSLHVKLHGIAHARWKIGHDYRQFKEDCINHQMTIIGLLKLKTLKEFSHIPSFTFPI